MKTLREDLIKAVEAGAVVAIPNIETVKSFRKIDEIVAWITEHEEEHKMAERDR